MRTLLPVIFLAAAWLSAGPSHAEGGCPPGQYPQQGQGWQTCVPIPGGSSDSAPASAPAPVYRTTLLPRWQAIATDATVAALGTSRDRPSETDAKRAAIADCHAKGGTDCLLQIVLGNGCAALVVGESTMNSGAALDKKGSEQDALSTCQKKNKRCEVIYSNCSFPVDRS